MLFHIVLLTRLKFLKSLCLFLDNDNNGNHRHYGRCRDNRDPDREVLFGRNILFCPGRLTGCCIGFCRFVR